MKINHKRIYLLVCKSKIYRRTEEEEEEGEKCV